MKSDQREKEQNKITGLVKATKYSVPLLKIQNFNDSLNTKVTNTKAHLKTDQLGFGCLCIDSAVLKVS